MRRVFPPKLDFVDFELATPADLSGCSASHYNCSAGLGGPFVDDQITVRLPTTLGRTLRRTSRRLGRRPSDVVRMALEAFLQGAPSTATKPAERVEYLIGSLSSGVPNLAERHREYLNVGFSHGASWSRPAADGCKRRSAARLPPNRNAP